MAKKSNKENFSASLNLSTITTAMIISGLIGIVISKVVSQDFLSNNPFWYVIIQIVEIIGTALFSAGLVSVIVEISTIKNLISDAFKKLLSGNFPLENIPNNSLKLIHKRIAAHLAGIPEKELGNTVYRYDKSLLDLSKERYYESHNMTYHITPDELNGCFHVKTKIDYIIINKYGAENFYTLRLKLYKINGIDSKTQFVLNKLEINGVPVPDKQNLIEIKPIKHESESTYYDFRVEINKKLTGTKNKIVAEFAYDVPLHDIYQSFKITLPTKSADHKFYITEDKQTHSKWIMQADAFSTFYHRQTDEGSNYKVEQNVDTSLTIKYINWALVGNGYCVYYQKAQE